MSISPYPFLCLYHTKKRAKDGSYGKFVLICLFVLCFFVCFFLFSNHTQIFEPKGLEFQDLMGVTLDSKVR